MITSPTTEQILLHCARVLVEEVLPSISDEPAQVRVLLCETVLRNAAVRSAHEVAWMTDEIHSIEDLGRRVAAEPSAANRVAGPLEQLTGEPQDSLHLNDVAKAYDRAGEV